MIVVAIIGVLAAIAVPTFITYRIKSRVAATVGTGESIRAALASFAADSADNLYPATAMMTDYASLRTTANKNGATLPATGSFTLDHYTRFDTDGDGVDDSYSMRLVVTGAAGTVVGSHLLVTPEGGGPAVCRGDNGKLPIAAGIALRVDALEMDVKKIKQKVKI